MLTTAEAAAALQVSRRRVNELIKLGTLKAKRFGNAWQVDSASVEVYKNSPRKAGRKVRLNQTNVATSGADKNEQGNSPRPNAEAQR